jgi:hypothetical protein
MAIGINWAEVWKPVWKPVWATAVAPAPDPAPRATRPGGIRRKYIIKDRLYLLTNEELAYMIARELIDHTREDIRVTYKNKKPHVIAKKAYESLLETAKRLESIIPVDIVKIEYDESDDEDAFLLLL